MGIGWGLAPIPGARKGRGEAGIGMNKHSDGTVRWQPYATHDDGLVGVYTHRVLDRGADPRKVAAEYRLARWGATEGGIGIGVSQDPAQFVAVGRAARSRGAEVTMVPRAIDRRPTKMLIAAAIALLVLLPLGAIVARAETPAGAALDLAHNQGMDIDIMTNAGPLPAMDIANGSVTSIVPGLSGLLNLGGTEPVDVSISESEHITEAVISAPEGTVVNGGRVVSQPPVMLPNMPMPGMPQFPMTMGS